MASIAVAGDTSGSITIQAPSVAGTNTLTLPASTGTVLTNASNTNFPTGSVLQVVQTYSASGFVTTSGSPQNTGISASITPSSSSNKILVLLSTNGYTNRNSVSVSYGDYYMYIYRGGSAIFSCRSGINFGVTSWTDMFPAQCNYTYLDSPSTTSSTTYTYYVSTSNGCQLTSPFQSFTTITLLEVKA
jgi:hypothetical protein